MNQQQCIDFFSRLRGVEGTQPLHILEVYEFIEKYIAFRTGKKVKINADMFNMHEQQYLQIAVNRMEDYLIPHFQITRTSVHWLDKKTKETKIKVISYLPIIKEEVTNEKNNDTVDVLISEQL